MGTQCHKGQIRGGCVADFPFQKIFGLSPHTDFYGSRPYQIDACFKREEIPYVYRMVEVESVN